MEQWIADILKAYGVKTIEVKLGGQAHLGLFAPYGANADITTKTGKELALEYVQNPMHGDAYMLSAYIRGSRGKGGQVFAYLYSRQMVFNAIWRFPEGTPSLKAHRTSVALGTCDKMAMFKTFQAPLAELPIEGLRALNQIVPDLSCKNAPYARAWEHYCNNAIGGLWVGNDTQKQFDIIINEFDE